MDESFNQYKQEKYDEAIQLLADAWEALPDGKNEYDESFLIVWEIKFICKLLGIFYL